MKKIFAATICRLTLVVLLCTLSAQALLAQTCNPDYVKGNECVDEAISFKANAPGFTTYTWEFKDASGTVINTSGDRDPIYVFKQPGTYTVSLKASGVAGDCDNSITVVVKPSPIAKPILLTPRLQCFMGNQFCYVDSSEPAPGSKIIRRTYLFGDGQKYDKINPEMGDTICHSVKDPKGGWFNLKIELEDANGCVTEKYIDSAIYISARLGVQFTSSGPTECDSTDATFTNDTYINWKKDPLTNIGLKDIAQFVLDFGDGEVIVGDSVTNTEYWTGENNDGKTVKTYRKDGKFDASLKVTSRFGCSATYVFKTAATNVSLKPKILADLDSSCTSEPTTCFRLSTGPIPGARFLWTFGDPNSGAANNNQTSWTPCHDYQPGPWMISLNIRSGPCNIMIYDTILKVGPTSIIEVPSIRVPEREKYQCQITDSVHFTNNSIFYHSDNNYWDEDSFFIFYPQSFRVVRHPITQVDSIFTYRNGKTNFDTLVDKFEMTDTLYYGSIKAYFDTKRDSFLVINGADTQTFLRNLAGVHPKRRFVFNYDEDTRQGDQTIIQHTFYPSVRKKDNVLRVWSLGDDLAPQCTTDTRANKNVGLNCNFQIDSLPVHWYKPWDEVYMTVDNGWYYKTAARKTLFSKNARQCFTVQVFSADTMVIPMEAVIFAPWDSTVVYEIPYVDSFGVSKTDTITIPAGVDFPEDSFRHTYRLRVWRPKTVYKGNVTSTVIWEDQKYYIPAGVTVRIKDLGSTQGNVRTVTGPRTETIKFEEQFEVIDGDSILSIPSLVINPVDTTYATPSTMLIDTVINGVPTTVSRDTIIVDPAYHRSMFYQNRALCNSVTLWHQDTVHDLRCETSNTISLALIPPSARGLRWEEGIPCPLDGNKLQYYLVFDMSETKPGCTQQWFEVNYDSLTGPNNWNKYRDGNVLAPPAPGNATPFTSRYTTVGAWGSQFVKGYSSGEVGTDPNQRPKGSFTIGLIVGNGQPRVDQNGVPIAPECTDTAWYSDMFRYNFLDADFDIIHPSNDPPAICAGESAYFRLVNPIQDSMAVLRWNLGYQDRLSGYYEEFQYFQEYKGPTSTRNDKDVVWDAGKDKWLYNFVVRHDLDEVYGDVVRDTIVTRIFRDWDLYVNTYQADKIITDLVGQLNLDIRDIPADEFALMLGDGSFGCIDTTGISQYFVIGKIGIEDNVVTHGAYKYQYTNEAKTDSVIVEQVLHFRDSSMQGYDTLIASRTIETSDGTIFNVGDTIPGLFKFTYTHPEVRINFCDPTKRDTFIVNSSGAMTPNLYLNNRVGCEKTDADFLNVGYLNEFKLANDAVCVGEVHEVIDSIRYWQYEDDFSPIDYPIDPRKFWEDPARFGAGNLELKAIDWNADDNDNKFERNLTFYHQYDEPGEYRVAIATQDSIGCVDTSYITAMVTGVKANFETDLNAGGDVCDGIVSFFDSSVVFDPCRGRDTCPGVYDACDSVVWYEWDFGDGSVRSVLKNPSHDYTSSGWFEVKLKITTLIGCQDSVVKRIFVAGPQPRFEFDGGSVWGEDSIIICAGDSVHILNTSRTPMTDPNWVMYWGDTATSGTKDINQILTHQYNNPGTYYLHMFMEDEVEPGKPPCTRLFPDTSTLNGKVPREIKVIVQPFTPAKLEISDTVVCPNQEVVFTSNSDTIYKYYQWAFGDGDTATRSEPVNFVSHSYTTPGTYKVLMIPDYDLPAGDFGPKCPLIDSGEVTVVDVTANFDIIDKDKPDYCFTNTSQGANNFEWKFETEQRDTTTEFTTGLDQDPSCQNWGETVGTFAICLIASNDIGCRDTICKTIENNFFIKFVPYNVFTPNTGGGDNKNDRFVIDIEGWEEYEINIYNRWGELVFKADDPVNSWDGTVMNNGTECPAGTYFYVINYKLKNRAENDGLEPVSGTVTLIRD